MSYFTIALSDFLKEKIAKEQSSGVISADFRVALERLYH